MTWLPRCVLSGTMRAAIGRPRTESPRRLRARTEPGYTRTFTARRVTPVTQRIGTGVPGKRWQTIRWNRNGTALQLLFSCGDELLWPVFVARGLRAGL